MTVNALQQAVALLNERYGAANGPGPLFAWSTLVKLVLAPRGSSSRKGTDFSWVENGPLHSARETASLRPAVLAEALKSQRQTARSAAVLSVLAGWWLKNPDRELEVEQAWEGSVESLREELRELPGVSLILADRILLHVGGGRAFPVDRAALRIACRHGWMDPEAEHEEWQAFFCRAAADSGVALADLSEGFAAVGRDYCGRRPDCAECPLQFLLPPSGPVPLELDEDMD